MTVHWNIKIEPAVEESMKSITPGFYDIEGEVTEITQLDNGNLQITYEVHYVQES